MLGWLAKDVVTWAEAAGLQPTTRPATVLEVFRWMSRERRRRVRRRLFDFLFGPEEF